MDRTQMVILAIFALVVLLVFLALIGVAVSEKRRREREYSRRWAARLAAPTEDVEELILGCEIFDMQTPKGVLRDDPEVARFLDLVRSHQHHAAARHAGHCVEGFLAHAEYRMGYRGRPVAMDYGYLDEVLAELVRRTRVPDAPYR